MADRRTEAFAVLDERDNWLSRAMTEMETSPAWAAREYAMLAALRSILTRHRPGPGVKDGGKDFAFNRPPWCGTCLEDAPCPDEIAVIDAVLGPEPG